VFLRSAGFSGKQKFKRLLAFALAFVFVNFLHRRRTFLRL